MYYQAKVKFETLDTDTGRTRKITEYYLVDAESISEAETKVKANLTGTIAETSIIGIQESNISSIIE